MAHWFRASFLRTSICWWSPNPPAGTRTRPGPACGRRYLRLVENTASHAGRRWPFCTGSTRKPAAAPRLSAKHRLPTNRSRKQFTERRVHKKYLLLTDREVPRKEFYGENFAQPVVGEKICEPGPAENWPKTKFTPISDSKFGNARLKMVTAEPAHRSHAPNPRSTPAESGFPILGDVLLTAAQPLRAFFFLQATEIAFTHPAHETKPVKFFLRRLILTSSHGSLLRTAGCRAGKLRMPSA